MPTTKVSTLTYLGGLFDGEGYAGVVRTPRPLSQCKAGYQRWGSLTVSMCDREPIDLLATVLGGKVSTPRIRNSKWKQQYAWNVTCNKAFLAALALLPVVRTKRRRDALTEVIQYQRQFRARV